MKKQLMALMLVSTVIFPACSSKTENTTAGAQATTTATTTTEAPTTTTEPTMPSDADVYADVSYMLFFIKIITMYISVQISLLVRIFR